MFERHVDALHGGLLVTTRCPRQKMQTAKRQPPGARLRGIYWAQKLKSKVLCVFVTNGGGHALTVRR